MMRFIILFLFFSLINNQLFSAEATLNNCSKNIQIYNKSSLQEIKINKISIKVKKHRKWIRNGINILIGNFRWVSNKYKKRFKADLIVNYANGSKCKFSATIRHSGNQKDHVFLENNVLHQSLDVHIKNDGNINGVSKFKLFLSNTKGNYFDEILISELLKQLDFISPRTYFIKIEFNGEESYRIFQEKPGLETINYYQRASNILYESDERFVFRLAEKIPDSNLSNWSSGMVPLLEDGINTMLSRQTNKVNITNKLELLKKISELNEIYLFYSNNYKNEKNNFFYGDYSLSNNLLSFDNKNCLLKLDVYNLFVSSVSGHHSLSANNRKFFWDEDLKCFEPINYDNNSNIDKGELKLIPPFSNNFSDSFNQLKAKLSKIDVDKIEKNLSLNEIQMDKKEIKSKINKILLNIDFLEESYYKNEKNFVDDKKKLYLEIDKYKANYLERIQKLNSEIKVLSYDSRNQIFISCFASQCKEESLSYSEIERLINGRLVKNNFEYQLLGFF